MKKKVAKKSRKPKNFLSRNNYSGIFAGLFGYFLFVFLVNLASKGLSKNLLFNPYDAALFLGEQISALVNLPVFILIILGFILTLVPFAFFYVVIRDLERNIKSLH